MIESVDRSAGAGNTRIPEFHTDGFPDPVVRVYHLKHARGEDLNHIIVALHSTGEIQKTFVDSEKGTLVVSRSRARNSGSH